MKRQALVGIVVARLDESTGNKTLDDSVNRDRLHSRQTTEAILRSFAFLVELDENHILARRQIKVGQAAIEIPMRLGEAARQQVADILVKAVPFIAFLARHWP